MAGLTVYELLRLADRHGEEAVLDWLKAGVPTTGLDVPALDYLLGAGITVERDSKDSRPPGVVLSDGTTSEEAERMDPGDFAATVDRHYPGLVQRLTLVLHDEEEAKDVAQEAYLRAFQAWDRFDGTDPRAWLHTIGLRLAFNALRRRRLWDRWRPSLPGVPDWVEAERVDLWRALGDLRPEFRTALLLNVVDGYTQIEIARILDVPAGTVAWWVTTAKARLRAILGDEPPE